MSTKKFYFDENKPPIVYRPGTSDESIIQTVLVERKEYAFPKAEFFNPKVIYDVGGNIGVVAVILANLYPNAMIHSFEPVKENFDLLKINTESYKNVVCHFVGLGRETKVEQIYESTDITNRGGFSTEIKSDVSSRILLKSVVDMVALTGVPDLIKIDCEGAEYDILTCLPGIKEVKWITGELHGIRDYLLLDYLSENFHIQAARNFQDPVWHFNAWAKNWTNLGVKLKEA